MKLYDVNIFDWGGYMEEGRIRVCLDAYPVHKTSDGLYYDTNTSVDPIRLPLTNEEALLIGAYHEHMDDWEHSDSLADRVASVAPRVYAWLNTIHNS